MEARAPFRTVDLRVPVALLAVLLVAPLAGADHVSDDELRAACVYGCEIPAIDDPSFDADPYVAPTDEVVGVEIDGDARAYPVKVLNYHEIVNDVVGGEPVAVTYCPLCDSGVAFSRRVANVTVSFRVSGWLYRNNLVMEDNVTLSWFSQITGEGIRRQLHGVHLDVVTSTLTTWGTWREHHPDTKLLARPDTHSAQTYEEDPYEAYRVNRDVLQHPVHLDPRDRMHPKTQVLGIQAGDRTKAYRVADLQEAGVLNDDLGGRRVAVAYVDGSANAYIRGDRTLSAGEGRTMVDDDGRTYSRLDGSGPDGGLEPVFSTRAFWYAWYDVHPDTLVHGLLDVTPDPGPGDGDVPRSATIRLAFDQPVDASSVRSGFEIRPPVEGRLIVEEDEATFLPGEALRAGTRYTVTLDGVRSTANDTLPATTWSFSTRGSGLPVPSWSAPLALAAAAGLWTAVVKARAAGDRPVGRER